MVEKAKRTFVFKERYKEYKEWIKGLKVDSSSYLAMVLDRLDGVLIKEGYTISTYYYSKKFVPENNRRSYFYKEKVPYVHLKDATLEFKPTLRRTFFQSLIGATPKVIRFDNAHYSEDMLIKDCIFTEDVSKTIPSPRPYLSSEDSTEGIWQFCFFLRQLSQEDDKSTIVFYEDALPQPRRPEDPFRWGYFMNYKDYESVVKIFTPPSIVHDDDNINVTYFVNGSNRLVKVEYRMRLNKKDNRVYVIDRVDTPICKTWFQHID